MEQTESGGVYAGLITAGYNLNNVVGWLLLGSLTSKQAQE